MLEAFILNGLILYNIDHLTDSVTHWDFLHTVTIKLTHFTSNKSCKKYPHKERNILLLLSKIRSLKHEWMICFSKDYCVVCKDNKTSCPLYSARSRKRRASLVKVNENIRVKGKVIEGGVIEKDYPIKKPWHQCSTQTKWECSSSLCKGLAFYRYKESKDCWSLYYKARFIS